MVSPLSSPPDKADVAPCDEGELASMRPGYLADSNREMADDASVVERLV